MKQTEAEKVKLFLVVIHVKMSDIQQFKIITGMLILLWAATSHNHVYPSIYFYFFCIVEANRNYLFA